MVTDKKLGFIGAGNMGEALLKGLLNTRAASPEQIFVSARRWIAVNRPTIEQLASVPKVEAALLDGSQPLRLIPLEIHHRVR